MNHSKNLDRQRDWTDIDPELRKRIKKHCIYLLKWVYTTDPKSINVSDEYDVPRGEQRFPDTLEEQKEYLGYQLKKRGRRNPVAILTTNLIHLAPESKYHLVFLLTELSEIDLCLSQNHVIPTVMRACSFLQQVLNERLGEGKNLSPIIRMAYENEVLIDSQVRLAQFIRLCRNDVSHNFAYDTEWGYEVHDHAAICSIALLNSLLESWYEVEWYVENRLERENCLRVIESEFDLEWDSKHNTYKTESINSKYDHRSSR